MRLRKFQVLPALYLTDLTLGKKSANRLGRRVWECNPEVFAGHFFQELNVHLQQIPQRNRQRLVVVAPVQRVAVAGLSQQIGGEAAFGDPG